jgi:hypothetical protein
MYFKKYLSLLLTIIVIGSIIAIPNSVSAKTTVKASKLTSVAQTDLTTAKITWSKVSGAKGYVLYYSTTGSKYKKLITTTKRSYTHKNLTNGKKYYYKLKTYTKVKGKTYYSKYSNIKTIRCNNYMLNFYSSYKYLESHNVKFFTGSNTFNMAGDEYRYGFTYDNCGNHDFYSDFNLKGKYKYIEITYGFSNTNNNCSSKLKILSDDDVVATYDFSSGDLPKTVKVNIQRANKLEFLSQSTKDGGTVGIGNIKLYK